MENSHASTSLSHGDGLAKGYSIAAVEDRAVVVVIGDGALTGGMAWEALNNIASTSIRSLIIVVNGNGRSYAPTIGGVPRNLAALFEDLGLGCLGPVDGHDIADTGCALRRAARYGRPLIVHFITRNGQGYAHAENEESDRFHAIGPINADTGKPLTPCEPTWTESVTR